MKSQQFLFLVAIQLAISMCSAHIGGHISYQDINPQIYCGRTLARALALLCFEEEEGGLRGDMNKRGESGTMYNSILSPYYKEQELPNGWPWIAPHKARSMELPSRGKRSVVNECCDKKCSINELLSYC